MKGMRIDHALNSNRIPPEGVKEKDVTTLAYYLIHQGFLLLHFSDASLLTKTCYTKSQSFPP
jgi:hypothetical protein